MLILLLCRLPLFCRVLLEEPLGKVLDGRRAALGLDFAERVIIGLGPNPRLDILGALASDTCFPAALSSRADGIAPFATGPCSIIDDEGFCTRRRDSDAEPRHLLVPYDGPAALWRLQSGDQVVGDFLPHDDSPVSAQCQHANVLPAS